MNHKDVPFSLSCFKSWDFAVVSSTWAEMRSWISLTIVSTVALLNSSMKSANSFWNTKVIIGDLVHCMHLLQFPMCQKKGWLITDFSYVDLIILCFITMLDLQSLLCTHKCFTSSDKLSPLIKWKNWNVIFFFELWENNDCYKNNVTYYINCQLYHSFEWMRLQAIFCRICHFAITSVTKQPYSVLRQYW